MSRPPQWLARRLRPDVCLLDIRMPKLDGLEAMRLLRSRDGPNRHTPVVAVTGSGAPDDIAACFQYATEILRSDKVYPAAFA